MVGKTGVAIRQQDRMSPEATRSKSVAGRANARFSTRPRRSWARSAPMASRCARSRAGPICRSPPSITTFRAPPPLSARWSSGCSTNCARSWRTASCARREPAPQRRSTRLSPSSTPRETSWRAARPCPPYGARCAARRNCAPSISPTRKATRKSSPPPSALSSRAPAEDVEALALVIIEGVWSALQLGCELPPEKRPRVRAMLKEFVAAALAGLMEKYRQRRTLPGWSRENWLWPNEGPKGHCQGK